MSFEITLFTNPYYLEQPQGLIGWVGWLAFLGLVIFLLWRWRAYNKKWAGLQSGILIVLALLLPVTSLFLVLRLPPGDTLPPPGRPVELLGPAIVIFAALPWTLAAGLLGPAPAALLGMLSGLVLALWDTHTPFTILEFALLAGILGAAAHQRFRTFTFRALRHPTFAALALGLSYPLVFVINTLLLEGGSLAIRLDYAFTRVGYASLAVGSELLIAGLFAEVITVLFPKVWGSDVPLRPSPAERGLHTRFISSLTPLAIGLVLLLMVGDWFVAGDAAEQMLSDRMASSAQMASEAVPIFMEAGQNLIQQLTQDERWYTDTPESRSALIEQSLRTVPFFRQLYLLDGQGTPIVGYPIDDFYAASPAPEELVGIDLALKGVPIQSYTIPPAEGETAAQVSFLATIQDDAGQLRGLLLGRSDIASNPFTRPIITSLQSMSAVDGEGILLDGSGRILYHSNAASLMQLYTGRTAEEATFYEDTAPDGTRRLVYYQPALGHPWAIVLTVPARQAQQLALTIAAPLLAIITLLFIGAIILLRLTLRVVTGSLHNLAMEANRISSGELDHPLQIEGEDEVGQLRRAFERMRASLKARLDELNRLLLVSQGVASSLEIEEAIQPVLESAITTGASSVRVVLSPEATPESRDSSTQQTRFGEGSNKDLYANLDEQILALTRQQDRIVLTNPSRARLLDFKTGEPRPSAILALALRHENLFYGTLWLAHDAPHQFSEDELRFLATLASQAALAAANARLFSNAEVGRQRLAAILASTPDPVLVTDHKNCLLLANPAAWQVLRLGINTGEGQPIEDVIKNSELLKLLSSFIEDKITAEVTLDDGKVYLATASSVLTESRRVGRICILRDITHLKELDALKSEFVATVSHDLRSPLTLMRGYATMLEMVGELNEQQTGYVRKIVSGVETMAHLVNNLLDLGRIEAGVDLQLEMVPVSEVIENVTGALQLQAAQKHLQITTEMPPHTVPLVEADHALLQQALHNLVENAIKYTEDGGKINIRVQVRQERMVFEVSDTGIGIAPVDQPRLFEKFYRGAQREPSRQRGSGLGLAIVKSIAERHGGQVWVESQLGQGSTFHLAIPLRQPSRAA